LSIVISSIAPYFSEKLFILMKKDINIDIESVHLLSYDDISTLDIMDDTKFESIDKLHEIIDLIRTNRGKRQLSFQVPIKDVLICSSNPLLVEQLQFLLSQLKSEANVNSLHFENIEEFSKVKIVPNRSVIGKEFKKEARNILKEIGKLDNNFILEELDSNEFINILDKKLTKEYFHIKREVTEIDDYQSEMDDELIIYINTAKDKNIILEYYSNVLSTNVQQFRKELDLNPWDEILVNYKSKSELICSAYQKFKDNINETIRYPSFLNNTIEGYPILGTKDIEIDDNMIKLEIYKKEEELEL